MTDADAHEHGVGLDARDDNLLEHGARALGRAGEEHVPQVDDVRAEDEQVGQDGREQGGDDDALAISVARTVDARCPRERRRSS